MPDEEDTLKVPDLKFVTDATPDHEKIETEERPALKYVASPFAQRLFVLQFYFSTSADGSYASGSQATATNVPVDHYGPSTSLV